VLLREIAAPLNSARSASPSIHRISVACDRHDGAGSASPLWRGAEAGVAEEEGTYELGMLSHPEIPKFQDVNRKKI
jgi:hypothetical protein